MMAVLWVVLFWASVCLRAASGLPIRPTPQAYPHESGGQEYVEWGSENGLYVLPALALVLTAVGLLFGCTWCYQHKDCKIFTASATHLHDARSRSQPPDSGFSEPVNNNINEDNNNGPISLREMQNIANNNAAEYIVSENEERNRINRESVVEFEPLPPGIRVLDPLERCADWFAGEDFPRTQLQYLREIGRGWFGRVVEGEIEDGPTSATVAVKILNQNASLEDKARFLDEARIYRDISHENVLPFIAKCLSEDPWLLMFELCSMDLQQYLEVNRPKMAILNEGGVPLQLMCDVASGLAHLHSRGYLYGTLWSGNVLVRGSETVRAVLGQYSASEPQHDCFAPEATRQPPAHTTSSEVWSLGCLLWEVCAWGAPPPRAPPPPHLPCPYRNHLYQVMQLCWNPNPENRPTAAQVHALLNHLHTTHSHTDTNDQHFEERWQRLKPNNIPKVDEHIAIVHAPSTSTDSQFGSDLEFESALTIQDSLSIRDTAVSRSSSIMSDKEPLSIQIKSESLNNLHGSFEDVRNIYLTHNEAAAQECHQGNMSLEEKEQDRSDSSVDPWLKDIITGSQDDVSYFKDVSDVIKNLDNILNSEKTSSSESSHQASPSRDNLSLECKKDYPMQTSLVKSPGIRNFQNILEMGFDSKSEENDTYEDDGDRDTIGTLSHSFERHSDTTSQYTLENITPETPIKDFTTNFNISTSDQNISLINDDKTSPRKELPNNKIEDSDIEVPKLKELCEALTSLCDEKEIIKDCVAQDNDVLRNDTMKEAKSVVLVPSEGIDKLETICVSELNQEEETTEESRMPVLENDMIKKANRHISSLVNKNNTVIINEPVETEKDFKLDVCTTRIHDIESVHADIDAPNKFNDIVESHESENKIDDTLVPLSSVDIDRLNFVSLPHRTSVSQMELSSPDKEESLYIKNDIMGVEAQSITPLPYGNYKQQPNVNEVQESPKIPTDLLKQQEVKMEFIEKLPTKDQNNLGKVNDNDTNNTMDKDKCHDLEIGTIIQPSENAVDLVCKKMIEVYSDTETLTEPLKVIENSVSKDLINKEYDLESEQLEITQSNLENVRIFTELPDLVQIGDNVSNVINNTFDSQSESQHTPVRVQTLSKENISSDSQGDEISCLEQATIRSNDLLIPTEHKEIMLSEQSTDSTVYMDFTDNEVSKDIKDKVKDIPSIYHDQSESEECILEKNDSTVYLDLPSVIREMDVFLHSEKVLSGHDVDFKDNVHASTPIGSNSSVDNVIESSKDETLVDSDKAPDYGVVLTKLEQKSAPDNFSPYESPTKSHHTDTYDENSSVVLGPFENCTLELFKGLKSGSDLVDLPKEELLAFSSNFSDINLETPSPLRDSNFLNEVPDLIHDELQFDEPSTSETKPVTDPHTDNNTDETEDQSTTEKRISPSTPPNSPGNLLASSQPYLVDIDFENESIQNIDINEMDVTQLAMAENENNMNIEYSGPLVEEGLNESMSRVNDTLPESYLAGNGGPVEETVNIAIDEERMKELRNELELKLPLAQVAGIEPASSWTELPPPPELLVTYGALSPIAEETRHQLTAYENDDNWNTSVRTESSESYPEPANNSTDEVTELPTALASGAQHSTYTVHSNHTYTLQRDATASKEITMSADSLNGSPLKKVNEDALSPIDDTTFTKNDEEKESNCERISQVSPFLLSPTTDTSAPDNSDLNAALSTLSKTSVPTDAKTSKPSETQCLSKATSIDSWCSNDTLYNVEENFDDLAMDPDLPLDLEQEAERDKSESEDTLTHNEDEKELSHCSTYIVHDSKSEACETFSPDSITANDNYTYTKMKTGTTPSVNTKSDLNDSTKNTQTKDLAYGTLGSGMPSFSNCTTELASGLTCDDTWKLPQPELVRRSPIGDDVQFTPPRLVEDKSDIFETPDIIDKPQLNKMDSVEITCFKEHKDVDYPEVNNDSPNINFKDVTNTMTSTPVTETDDNNKEVIPCPLSQIRADDSEISAISLTYFQEPSPNNSKENKSHYKEDVISGQGPHIEAETSELANINSKRLDPCVLSAEIRHQNLSNTYNTDGLGSLEGNCQIVHNKSVKPEISDNSLKKFESFQRSAEIRPQDLSNNSNLYAIGSSKDNTSSQSLDTGKPEINNSSLKNFEVFVCSAELRPQDLSNNKVDKTEISCNSSKNIESFIRSAEMRPQDLSNTALISVPLAKPDISDSSLKTFQSFLHSAEIRPQDISPNNIDASEIKCKEESIPSKVPEIRTDDSESSVNSLTNFQSFLQSAEMRPQEMTTSYRNESGTSPKVEVSDRESQLLSQNSNADSLPVSKKSLSYTDFVNSASLKPQEVHSMDKSSHSEESGVGSEGFRNFESSARDRPQDLLSLIDASSLLLNSERASSEHIMNSFLNKNSEVPSTSRVGSEPSIIINPTFTSFRDTPDRDSEPNIFITDLDLDDENEQPHSIIITESPLLVKTNLNQTFDSHEEGDLNDYDSHSLKNNEIDETISSIESVVNVSEKTLNKSFIEDPEKEPIANETNEDIKCNGSNEVFATVHFLNESFEELVESNVDDNDGHEANKGKGNQSNLNQANEPKSPIQNESVSQSKTHDECTESEDRAAEVTQDFLQNEKNFCQLNAYFPLLSDIRFTGPGSEIMSTSFTQESPTEPTSPECERDSTTEKDKPSELLKEWDSDTDSHSTNSSSGEFIWKDGDGYETALVPNTQFEHQRDSGQPSRAETGESVHEASSAGSGDSGSGSEGDEVEFVPSSWDCRAAPAKSSLRSLEQPADGKKRVVFKRQKYHCVYEYPREASDLDVDSPAHYLPDLSTYCEWDPRSAEEAEVGYGQLFGAPSPLDMFPLRSGIAFGADYDEDFFISSSARPFELGVLSTTSQFFPGMHLKQSLLPEHDDFPPPPSPLPPLDHTPLPLSQTRMPSLDFTTPDSGVEDITPGSTTDDDLKMSETWKPDSTSSSESVSPSSPGGELGGLRHTRDKLKLDLPPSPHLPSPRHSRVFNFVLEKPKRPAETNTPLVMSDETPIMMTLPVCKRDDPMPEPTFSTFGKPTCKSTADSKNIVLTDNSETVTEDRDVPLESADILPEDVEMRENEEVIMKTPEIEEKTDKVEPVKGEGTVLDSGDEDSGIESSSKATLERKPASNVT